MGLRRVIPGKSGGTASAIVEVLHSREPGSTRWAPGALGQGQSQSQLPYENVRPLEWGLSRKGQNPPPAKIGASERWRKVNHVDKMFT